MRKNCNTNFNYAAFVGGWPLKDVRETIEQAHHEINTSHSATEDNRDDIPVIGRGKCERGVRLP